MYESKEKQILTEPAYGHVVSVMDASWLNDTTSIVCPNNITSYTDLNSCVAIISTGLDLTDPNNSIASLSWEMTGATEASSNNFGINQIGSYSFNEGTTVVTYRGATLYNNSINCTFTVTVSDNQVPRLISSPGHITVRNLLGECYVNVTWTEPSAVDNCVPQDQLIFTSNYSSGQQFQVGSTQVEYRISDGVNTAVHNFTVTVIDAEAPELIAPPDLESECGKPVPDAFTAWEQFEQAGGSANDNCSINYGSFRYTGQTSSGITCPYTVTRTYSISDNDGNVSEVKHVINVIGDGMAYEANVESTEPEILLEPGAETQAEILFAKTDVSCKGSRTGVVDLTLNGTSGIVSFVWSTQNGSGIVQGAEDQTTLSDGDYTVMVYEDGVRLLAFDFSILVFDDQAPVLNAPSTIQRNCGQFIPAAYSTWSEFANAGGTVRDNCQIYYSSFRLSSESQSNPDCPYTLTRIYEITDVNGNRGFAEHLITVEAEEIILKSGMAGTITAQATGDWNVASTWDCNCIPAFDDDVIIPAGFTVTVDAAAVTNNITIETGGTLNGGASTLQVNGNWTNNGTFTASTGTIEFTGTTNAIISGSSATTFNNFILNKGTDVTTDLAVQSDITITDLTFDNGVLDVESGITDIADIVNINNTIPSTSGLRVSGGTLTTGYYSIINEGLIEVTSGTATFGTGSGNTVHTQIGGAFIVSGGTVNIAGRLENTTGGTLAGYPSGININGGTITLATAGNNESGTGSLDVTTNGAFNFTGGTIIFENPSTAGTALDLGLVDGTGDGAKTITNGIFQFGNNNTIVGSTFYIDSNVPIPNITTFAGSELYLAMPPDDGETVACASSATQPTPPDVYDNCGALITPTGPDVGGTYVDCEGTITYTWEYLDCDGTTTTNWVYTYTIERQDFTMPETADGTTVSCIADAVLPTSEVPSVSDNCGNVITPAAPTDYVVTSYDGCEGDVTYTYTFTDCEGNTHDWVYTYTIERQDFTMPETADGTTVSCIADAVLPAAEVPSVSDNCGNVITPAAPTDYVVTSYDGCEGDVTYTYTFTDCEGNTHDWVYTYTIERQDFTMPETADGTTVSCIADAVLPTSEVPSVSDNCGNVITPAAPTDYVVTSYDGCEGDVTYTYTFTDCEGNTHDWVYTYTIERQDFTMPETADGTTVSCIADAVLPTSEVPSVSDNCGNVITPAAPTDYVVTSYDGCEGDVTYTYTFTDCEGNTHDWVYTYTIERQDFTMPETADGTTVSCIADAVLPTAEVPSVSDNCGNVITPAAPTDYVVTSYDGCEGDVTYTYTFTDCEGNTHDWVYTYTIERQDFTMPETADGTTVSCIADAVLPTSEVPSVSDNCGNVITPAAPTDYVVTSYDGCEGDVTYTYTFTDCEGNTHDWVYTYTIERQDFTMPETADGTTVSCIADAVLPTSEVPSVSDNCGNVITPAAPTDYVVTSYDGCEGDVTYTYTFTDCEGNTHDWVYTYTIERQDFTMPETADGTTVSCIADAVLPTSEVPSVSDNCGNVITPTAPTDYVVTTYDGCEGDVTYTYTFTDCEGNTHDWVYTYTIERQDFTMPETADGTTVSCIADAVLPTSEVPSVSDNCGNVITPAAPTDYVVTSYDGCEGDVTYTYTFTDCEGNTHDWVYTYTIERQDFTMPETADGMTVSCIADAVLPTSEVPSVSDNCGNVITPAAPTDYVVTSYDGCEGDVTYTYTFTDCEGNTHDWVYTYTIERQDFTMPETADGTTVSCIADAVLPTSEVPSVSDNCGNVITPAAPTDYVVTSYDGCEGDVTYTYTFTDCEGNTHDWVYTYTIERQDFTMPETADGTTVSCIADAVLPTAEVPSVSDNCGNVITPAAPTDYVVTSYDGCEGDVTYTYTFTDCEGNTHDWVYTYTIERQDFTMPETADGTTVSCIADAVLPTSEVPSVSDNCGNVITPAAPTDYVVTSYDGCEGDVTYTYTFTDCEGNTHDWVYTYTIERQDFTMPETADGTTVSCIADAVLPTSKVPSVSDNCGNVITPAAPTDYVVTTYDGCEGDVTYTYTFTDCEGNTHDWVYTYTIERQDFTMPETADGTTVSCIADAVLPTAEVPSVSDNCGNVITPAAPTDYVVTSYDGCEGDVTYTYTFTDCEGNTHDWVYTYTIERQDFTMPETADGTTVSCIADAVLPTSEVPSVSDNCGNVITPAAPTDYVVTSYDGCEGDVTYTYTFTDCEGNTHDWVYTYTIERQDFTMPETADGTTVSCIADAVLPTSEVPSVSDNCGNVITPAAPTDYVVTSYDGCEGDVTYTYTFTDCEGNTHDWVYTYTIERQDFTMPETADGTTVSCIADAVLPTSEVPSVSDNCGNVITPTAPTDYVVTTYDGCEGDVTYTYTFTDCEGNTHDWVYTYTIERQDFTMPETADGTTVSCIADAVLPTSEVPSVSDNCGNVITPAAPTDYVVTSYDGCEGDVTYTYTFTDCEGNTHDWVYTYTIERQDFTMPETADGMTVSCIADAVLPTSEVPSVSDNCGNVITPAAPTDYVVTSYDGCEGDVTYTYTFTDCEGNTHDWVYTYTIERQDFTMPANQGATVDCIELATEPTPPIVTDNCGNSIIPTGPAIDVSSTCDGTKTYSWTYEDCAGHLNQWDYVYTINDDILPTWTTTANNLDRTVECSDGTGLTSAQALAPVASDNCAGTISYTKNSGVFVPVAPGSTEGTYTNTWTAADVCGNITATLFTQVITIIDTTPPTITCPGNLAANTPLGVCGAVITYTTPVGTDNCTGATTVQTAGLSSGSTFPVGVTTNTFEVTDAAGNSNSCSFTVTITDNRNPVLTIPATAIIACNESSHPDYTGWATATDNCAVDTIFYTDSTGIPSISCASNYTIYRTWEAEDIHGNKSSGVQEIKLSDVDGPEVVFANQIIEVDCPNDIPGYYETLDEFLASNISNDSYDLCSGSVTMELYDEYSFFDPNSGVAGYCPDSVSRVYRFYDECLNYTELEQKIIVSGIDTCSCTECTEQVNVHDVDLRADPDSVWVLLKERRDKEARCCLDDEWWLEGGDDPYRCVSFNVIIDNDAVGVQIETSKGQDAKEWRIDCENVSLEGPDGDIICLPSGEYHHFTHCKQGADPIDYIIRSVRGIIESGDISTRVDCSHLIHTTGDFESVPVWSALNPLYDKYLDTSDPYNPTFFVPLEDKDDVPSSIQYQVCADVAGYICGQSTDGTICDTITVNVYDPIETNIDLGDLIICEGTPVDIEPQISPAGDYVIEWFEGTGASGTPIHTGYIHTIETSGWYSIKVTEYESGLPCNVSYADFEVEVDLTRPGLSTPPDTLFLSCDDPDADQKIIDWYELASAFIVDAYGDTVEIDVTNNFSGINMYCGEVLDVEFKAVDLCNNDSIDIATIVVIDTTPPTITPAFDSIADCNTFDHNTYDGYLAWLANHGGATASDICQDPETLTWSVDTATAVWVGNGAVDSITVEFTVTDDCGNPASTTATFTIVDDEPPTIDCPEDVVQEIIDGGCDLSDIEMDSVLFDDNCGIDRVIWEATHHGATDFTWSSPAEGINYVNGETFSVGHTTVTYTIFDNAGLSDTCSFDVFIQNLDNPNFEVTCPDTVIEYVTAGNCDAPVTVPSPTISNFCNELASMNHDSPYSTDSTNASGTYPTDTTVVTWTIIDGSEKEYTCEQLVIVIDTIPPTIDCRGDVVQEIIDGGCDLSDVEMDSVLFDDNCVVVSLEWRMIYYGATTDTTYSSTSGFNYVNGETFGVGHTLVTYTVYDNAGLSATCSFDVFIQNLDNPNFEVTCPDTVIEYVTAGNCDAPVTVPSPTISNFCNELASMNHDSPYSTDSTNASGTYPTDTTVVTWTIIDGSEKEYTCEQLVIVIDTIPPTIDCRGDVVQEIIDGGCDLSDVEMDSVLFDDNCVVVSLEWRTIYYGATTDTTYSSTSGFNYVNGETFGVGHTLVTYTVYDNAGLSATCSFDVFIRSLDDPPFEVTCSDTIRLIAQQWECGADVTIVPPGIYNPCNELFTMVHDSIVIQNPDPSGFYPLDTTIVTWTITDASETEHTCEQVIIIEDIPPIIDCPDTLILDAEFDKPYVSNITLDTAVYADNCPDPTVIWERENPDGSMEYSPLLGINFLTGPETFYVDTTRITYTIIDDHGNTDDCSFLIIVRAAPDIDCPPDTTIYLDPVENDCDATYDPGVPELIEGVPPITWTFWLYGPEGNLDTTGTYVKDLPDQYPDPFGEYDFELGVTTIKWEAQNVSGYDTCSHWVEVKDTIPPTLDADPYENCVDPLHWAIYNENNPDPVYNHLNPLVEKFPVDYRTMYARDTFLDLTSLEDNCCDSTEMTIHWRIEFSDTPDSDDGSAVPHDDITGTGQPSEYVDPDTNLPTDILLWGDGVTFYEEVHHIFYWAEDCNGNISDEIMREITITPRPEVRKTDY
nr:HYR domain-containing protein [uncultured Draconibacterium sp.]